VGGAYDIIFFRSGGIPHRVRWLIHTKRRWTSTYQVQSASQFPRGNYILVKVDPQWLSGHWL